MSGHEPVLLREVRDILAPRPGGAYLDLTFGGGSHSRALLETASGVTLVAFDCDPEAEARAARLAGDFPGQVTFYGKNFDQLESISPAMNFDGILMDLGVSSFQLDTADRGFSFREEAEPDMRLDPREGVPAWRFLEEASDRDLTRAVRDYGEEMNWRRIVAALKQARGTETLRSTRKLADWIAQQVPAARRAKMRIHPATKTFQGLRIAVNDELGALERTLPLAWDRLSPGGVLAVISFHSLEDRIVKRFFREKAGMPVDRFDSRTLEERTPEGELLSRKPIEPSEEEVARNPRSRSSRLRAIRRHAR